MTKISRVLLALVFLSFAGHASAQLAVKSTQEILIELEQNWISALKRNDVKFVDSVLAEEFIATYGDGTRGDRKHELKLVADFNAQVDEWLVGEFTVKVYDDTAVVW